MKTGSAVLGEARGGFHVHRDRAGFLTESLLLARIANQFGRGQEPATGTRQGRGVDRRPADSALIRHFRCQDEIADFLFRSQRPGETNRQDESWSVGHFSPAR